MAKNCCIVERGVKLVVVLLYLGRSGPRILVSTGTTVDALCGWTPSAGARFIGGEVWLPVVSFLYGG